MAAKATFDLDNLLVIFDKVAPDGNGKVTIDTQVDIYSDAKEVWNSSALYPGFEFPFTTIGGNDLGGGLAAGDYYFLRTDLGWRMRPYESDHELTITGNIYPIDATDPLMVPTSSAYTVPVIFERSQLTQTVTNISATVNGSAVASSVWGTPINGTVSGSYGEVMKTMAFNHVVYFDSVLGTAGTTYPVGTLKYPVNNFADAVAIASTENATLIHMDSEGVILSTDDVSNQIIEGHHPGKVQVQVSAGADTTLTQFREVNLRNATLNGQVVIRDSFVNNITDFQGVMHRCQLDGTVALTGAGQSTFLHCFAATGGFELDANGKNADINISEFYGAMTLTNNTGNNIVEINVDAAHITLASTCTNGTITVRGEGTLVDNSAGATVIDEITTTGALTSIQDERLRELHQIFGLEVGTPLVTTASSRTAGASVTQAITGDPETSITVTRAP